MIDDTEAGRLGESRRPHPTSGFPADSMVATGHFDAPSNTTGSSGLPEGLEAWMTVAPSCRLHLCHARHLRTTAGGDARDLSERIEQGKERVARCTAPGAGKPRSASTVWALPGVNRTTHISLRMRERYMSIKGCESKCQFLSLYRTGIAPCELRNVRPRVLISAARQRRLSDRRRNADIRALWPRRRAIATGTTGAPSPAPWCP